MKHFLRIIAAMLLSISALAQEKVPVISPYNYIDLRTLYLDSVNHHTALKTILHEDTSALYKLSDTTKKRGWVYRKLFNEHLMELREREFNVFVDVLGDLNVGRTNAGNGKNTWLNTRGGRIQGNIGTKLYFETSFYENQGAFAGYLDTFIQKYRVVPGQGEVKKFNGNKAFDYAYVNAMLSYTPSKFLNLTMGYGTNSIGDGYRSLILSDIAFSYPYLKATLNLGNVQYTSMWAQFQDSKSLSFRQAEQDAGYYKKWGVFHFLDWNINKKITVGVFDAVMWNDYDTTSKRKRGFDWSYMSPIIFLRPAEFSVGSSDNAMIGLNAKYKVLPKTTVYGQFMLDEFKLKEFFGGNGWWANKWAMQLGFRAFDLFKVNKLDLQGEYNVVRPYTYSFRNSFANYAHYNQSLAHPLGANFQEVLGIATYTYKRWYLRGQLTYSNYGIDPDAATNYGKDIIFKDYTTRLQDYNNKIGQGIKTDLLYGQATLAYVFNPKYNLRLEASLISRQEKNDLYTNKETIFQFGVRTTFRQFYYDF